MAVTKANPLYERVVHAFGEEAVRRELNNMISTFTRRDPLQHLTDDARNELVYRLISDLRLTRRSNAESRRRYAGRAA